MNGLTSKVLSQLPNSLTLLRLWLAIGIWWLPPESWPFVVAIAAATEFLDGFLARRLNAVSRFGRLMDPVADKAFVLSSGIRLVTFGWLSVEHLIAISVRDLTVALGVIAHLFKIKKGRADLRPRLLGKVATAFQLALLIWIVYRQQPASLLYIGLVSSVSFIAAIDYATTYFKESKTKT